MFLTLDDERSIQMHKSAVRVAGLFLRAGENGRAIEALERAFLERDPGLPYIGCAPMFNSVREDPRFQDLMRRMNLPL